MREQLFQKLALLLQELSSRLLALKSMENKQTENSIKLYEKAKASLGIDITPRDVVPDTHGCAEAVNEICRRAIGVPIGGGASTYEMFKALQNETRFIEVDSPLPGDIIISPTGYGRGNLPHGHVGIVAKQGILSNSSESGKIELNFTLGSWARLYNEFGGYPVHIFRLL